MKASKNNVFPFSHPSFPAFAHKRFVLSTAGRTCAAYAFLFLFFFSFSPLSPRAAQVAVPDPVLERAIESHIGDNGISGYVDGDWLVGRDGSSGAYTGPPAGLTALGFDGEQPSPVSGAADLAGLEAAAHLRFLFLRECPLSDLRPLVNLENLYALGFDCCDINDGLLEQLAAARFSPAIFALVNSVDNPVLFNRVHPETLYHFISGHPGIQRLALTNLGVALDMTRLTALLRRTTPPCERYLHLGQNPPPSLHGLAVLSDLVHIDLDLCSLTNAHLSQVDWGKLPCLQTLNLSENAVTHIEPLSGLIVRHGASAPVSINLGRNRLDDISITEYIPALEKAGHSVSFDMELFVAVEGEGDVPPSPGSYWRPYGASVYRLAVPRPDSNQGFVGWRGDVITDDYGVTVELTTHRRLTAVFSETPPPGRRFVALTMTCAGAGAGAATPRPGTSLYRDGELIDLIAAPEPGSYFGGWRIVFSTAGDDGQYHHEPLHTLELTDAASVTARFDTTGHTLSLEVAGAGSLSVPPGSYPITAGAVLTLRALSAPGHRLKRWEDGSGHIVHLPADDNDVSLEFAVNNDAVIRAVFEEAVRTLTMVTETEGDAAGETLPSGDARGQAHVFAYGETVPIEARPKRPDCAFAGWRGDLPADFTRKDMFRRRISLTMTEDRRIVARFAPAEVRLYLDVTLDGRPYDGLLPADHRVHGFIRDPDNETLVTIDLRNTPFAFVQWEGDVPATVNARDVSITTPMDRDRHLTAALRMRDTLSIHVTVEGEGTVTPRPGTYAVVPGRTMTFNASPEGEQHFLGWRISDVSGGERFLIAPEITLELDSAISIEARFGTAAHRLWIGATRAGGAVMPPEGVYHVGHDAAVDLQATPPEDAVFHHWADGDGNVISLEPATRVLVSGDCSYHAVFGPPGNRLTIETEGEGAGAVSVFPEGGLVRPPGSTVKIEAVPNSDSVFARWEGVSFAEANPAAPVIELTLDQDRRICAVFDKANYRLTVETAGLPEGVSAHVSPAPGVHGYRTREEAILFAAPPPDSDYAFVGWEGSLDKSSLPEHRVRMSQDRYVLARFAPVEDVDNKASLTVLPSEGEGRGTLQPLSPGIYHFVRDAVVTLSFSLDGDSYFCGWTGDYQGDISYDHLPVLLDEDRKVGARFTATGALLTIGLNNKAAGSVSPPPGGYRLGCGVEVALTATRANTRWRFTGWYDDSGRMVSPYARHVVEISPDVSVITLIAVFQEPLKFSPIEYAFSEPHFTRHDFPRHVALR